MPRCASTWRSCVSRRPSAAAMSPGGSGSRLATMAAPDARPQRQRRLADAQMRVACAESPRRLERQIEIAIPFAPYDDLDRPARGSTSVNRAPSATRSVSPVVDSVGWKPSSQVSPLWSRLLASSVTRNDERCRVGRRPDAGTRRSRSCPRPAPSRSAPRSDGRRARTPTPEPSGRGRNFRYQDAPAG